jgi:hypothetical protein
MRRFTFATVMLGQLAAVVFLQCQFAAAQSQADNPSKLKLTGDDYWVVVASRRDLNEAIAVARFYSSGSNETKVLRSSNGWYGIVLGPEKIADTKAYLSKLHADRYAAYPKDVRVSRGANFVERVWAPPVCKPLAKAEFDGKQPVTLKDGDVEVKLAAEKVSSDGSIPTAVGSKDGVQIFAMRMPKDYPIEEAASTLDVLQLDKKSSAPQFVFRYYWKGAHCCTVTKIATLNYAGLWKVVSTEPLNGGGYRFEDIDGDGSIELINNDNSFLYAFASYAESFSPPRISKVVDGELRDVTADTRYRSFLIQEVARMEFAASLNSELWNSNGFLGAWVAVKALVGQGENAWSKMLANYDRSSDWPLEECKLHIPLDKCPDAQRRSLSFPEALRKRLQSGGYKVDYAVVAAPGK